MKLNTLKNITLFLSLIIGLKTQTNLKTEVSAVSGNQKLSVSSQATFENTLTYADGYPKCHKKKCHPKKLCCPNKGMTWAFYKHDCTLGIDSVGCSGTPVTQVTDSNFFHTCQPHVGDTPCVKTLPILCIQKLELNRPPYQMECSDHANTKESYCGWTGALLALSKPIQGCRLSSRAYGDHWCSKTVGCGYVMAEFHDGRYIKNMDLFTFAGCTWNWPGIEGGWHYYGYSNLSRSKTRWWTAIDDQLANCWNSLGNIYNNTQVDNPIRSPFIGIGNNNSVL